MSSGSTLIIVPAYNEEASLPDVLGELKAHAAESHVVVVVDGATDNTSNLARAAGVAVLDLPFNLGIGGALQTGFRYAVRHGYPRAVQFDADGQHDAESINLLLNALDSGLDLVVGSRFGCRPGGDGYAVGRVRGGGMAVLRSAARLMTGRNVGDATSGFRAFSAPMLQYFAENYPVEYMDSIESLLLAQFAGFRVGEVAVQMHERSGGKPSQQRLRLLYHYLRVLVVIVSARPSRLKPR